MSNPIQDAPNDLMLSKEAIRKSIHENAVVSAPYLTMNAFATIVASYGLLQNSTAVVIGAMIIAMLLGPISGIALALVSGDDRLLRKALLAELSGVVIVLIIAFIIGKIHQDIPLTDEILSRTSPNILDLMIALAGGAAGAYATVSPRLSVGLVGVAIATALVPPLAACSICLAHGETRLAVGGFLLFFANFVAIQFASSVVMFLHGYHKVGNQELDSRHLVRRHMVSLVLLIGLALLLGYDFSRSMAEQRFEITLRAKLEKELKAYPGVYLADLRFSPTAGAARVVTAVVRSPYSFTPERVGDLEAELPTSNGMRVELHVRSVITKEATRYGYVNNVSQEANTPVIDPVAQ